MQRRGTGGVQRGKRGRTGTDSGGTQAIGGIPILQEADLKGKQFDIPADAYGAAILAIVHDSVAVFRGDNTWLNATQATFSMGLISLNLLLQFGIVVFVDRYVVQPKIYQVQMQYKRFHGTIFDPDGNFMEDRWEDYGGKDDLCEIAMTSKWFYLATLFLWFMTMLKEFVTCMNLIKDINSVPTCAFADEMLMRNEDDKKFIVALTPVIRRSLQLLVIVPKFCIATLLLYLGGQWLTATTQFEDLVMNAVAMEFVLQIDEYLYDVLLPMAYRAEVENIDFLLPPREREGQAWQRRKDLMVGYRTSALYFCTAVILVLIYGYFLQDVLPSTLHDVKMRCDLYLETQRPFCFHSGLARFLHTPSHDDVPCYPFGSS